MKMEFVINRMKKKKKSSPITFFLGLWGKKFLDLFLKKILLVVVY